MAFPRFCTYINSLASTDAPSRREYEMVETIVAPHGLFYMENAGGYKPAYPEIPPSMAAEEHQRFGGGKGRRLEGQRRNGTGH
jgi:hypothetical protein